MVGREVVAVLPRMTARASFLAALGLQPAEHRAGSGVGQQIAADATGRTAVPGVWVADNVTDLAAQVGGAAAAARSTPTWSTRQAVIARRVPFSAGSESAPA